MAPIFFETETKIITRPSFWCNLFGCKWKVVEETNHFTRNKCVRCLEEVKTECFMFRIVVEPKSK